MCKISRSSESNTVGTISAACRSVSGSTSSLGSIAPCVAGSAQLSLVLVIVAQVVSGIRIYFLLPPSHQSHHKEDKSNY